MILYNDLRKNYGKRSPKAKLPFAQRVADKATAENAEKPAPCGGSPPLRSQCVAEVPSVVAPGVRLARHREIRV